MDIQDVKTLSYNPFFSAKLFVSFLSGCIDSKIKHELIYLVLPFLYHKDSRLILLHANKNSTLNSLFLDNSKGVICLGGFEKRYIGFQDLTKKSLIVACNEYEINLGSDIDLKSNFDYRKEPNYYVRDMCKSSYNLGIIISKMGYLDAFSKLNIR